MAANSRMKLKNWCDAEFKSLSVQQRNPKYETEEWVDPAAANSKPPPKPTFVSKVTIPDGRVFHSLGPFGRKKLAEESAADVAWRTINSTAVASTAQAPQSEAAEEPRKHDSTCAFVAPGQAHTEEAPTSLTPQQRMAKLTLEMKQCFSAVGVEDMRLKAHFLTAFSRGHASGRLPLVVPASLYLKTAREAAAADPSNETQLVASAALVLATARESPHLACAADLHVEDPDSLNLDANRSGGSTGDPGLSSSGHSSLQKRRSPMHKCRGGLPHAHAWVEAAKPLHDVNFKALFESMPQPLDRTSGTFSVVLIPCPNATDAEGAGDGSEEKGVPRYSAEPCERQIDLGHGGSCQSQSVLDCIAEQGLRLACGAGALLATRVLTPEKQHPKVRIYSPLPASPSLLPRLEEDNSPSTNTSTAPSDLHGSPTSPPPHALGGLPLNPLASWLAGHPVYGPAVAAAAEPSFSSLGIIKIEDVRLIDVYRLALNLTPAGAYALSCRSPFLASLPSFFPSPKTWRGKLPKSLLMEQCLPQRPNAFNPLACGAPRIMDLSESGTGRVGFTFRVEIPLTGTQGKDGGILVGLSSKHFPSKADAENSACLDALHQMQGHAESKAAALGVPSFTPWSTGGPNRSLPPSGGGGGGRETSSSVVGVPGGFLSAVMGSISSVWQGLLWGGSSTEGGRQGQGEGERSPLHKRQKKGDTGSDAITLTLEGSSTPGAQTETVTEAETGSFVICDDSMVVVKFRVLFHQGGIQTLETAQPRTEWGTSGDVEEQAVVLDESDSFSFRVGMDGVVPELESALLGKRKGEKITIPLVPRDPVFLSSSTNQDQPKSSTCAALQGKRRVGQVRTVGFLPVPRGEPLLCHVAVEVLAVEAPEEEEARVELAVFSPSLSRQRNAFAIDAIRRRQPRTLVDLGCGRGVLLGEVLSACLEDCKTGTGGCMHLECVVGTDIVERDLQGAAKTLVKVLKAKGEGGWKTHDPGRANAQGQQCTVEDDVIKAQSQADDVIKEQSQAESLFDTSSTSPSGRASAGDPVLRRIVLMCGSVAALDTRIQAPDMVTCIEVVEHLDEGPLAAIGPMVLGCMRPKAFLVSTPNFEYNPIIKAHTAEKAGVMLTSASEIGGFRNSDHRFEWTRGQFKEWACGLAAEFGYRVEFSGVGELEGGKGLGFASQFAMFARDLEGSPGSVNVPKDPYNIVWRCDLGP